MHIYINKDTKVFISCPANSASGGPELLHQLGFHFINDLKVQAFMYYYNFDKDRNQTTVHPEYEFYNVPYVLEISIEEDIERNILIVPEVISGLSLLSKYRNIRKGIWFLSVDNFYFSKMTKKDLFLQKAINKVIKLFYKKPLFEIRSVRNLNKLARKYDYANDSLLKLADFYMINSYRGLKWFSNLKPLYYLSEYLAPSFLNLQTDLSKKENIVAFNPKKGLFFTDKIIQSAPDIKFVPLINFTRQQIIETLQKAKVYIDFGNHPGKDRIPREAAILGCCVITGKRGSAAYFEDVPIPDDYKFEDKEKNIPKIIDKIKDCFQNFYDRYKDFEYYRKVIKQEPERFVEDLKKIFVKIYN